MKIGTKGHYAVAAMVELAKNIASEDLKKPVPLSVLAETQNISVNYLELLFIGLRKRGLVKSVRGVQGGYFLGKPSFQINVLEILTAVDEGLTVTRCKVSSTPQYCFDQKTKCTMHAMWKGLGEIIHDYLAHISLEDLSTGNLGRRQKLELKGIDYISFCDEYEKTSPKRKIVSGCKEL